MAMGRVKAKHESIMEKTKRTDKLYTRRWKAYLKTMNFRRIGDVVEW